MFRHYLRKLCLFSLLLWLIYILVVYKQSNRDQTPTNTSWEIHIQPVTRFDLNNSYDSGTTENDTIESTKESTIRKWSKPDQRFFVLSSKCQMPYLDWFGDDIWKIVPPLKFKSCTNEPSLISALYNSEEKQYRLHINYDVLSSHFSNYSEVACTYSEIVRGTDDTFSYLMTADDFDQDWVVPSHFLGVMVECHEVGNKSNILQKDAFSFVQQPQDHDDKADAIRAATYPSVFIFGIDSMSRMNFRRMMPLTWKFVRQPGWFEMEGYNKVADNTLPNLIAILTGGNPTRWRRRCDMRTKGCFDYMTFLWNSFHNAGYLTAYAEDMSTYSIFNYLKSGFIRKPVDFYLRPFMIVVEQILKSVEYLGFKYCLGRRLSFDYIFDFARQLIQRFVHENPKPLFGLFWTSSFTHDDFRGGHLLDGLLVDYLKEFEEYGLFNKSVVILLSDHGSRFGFLAQHYTGFLEERLPMLHVYLPPWYRERYPSVVEALQLNKNRLCSNYDLHLGIRQLLEQVRPGLSFSEPCVDCQSILRPLPVNRSCEEALIPRHWCTCQPFVQVEKSEYVQTLAKTAVYRMNKFLQKLNLDGYCHRLRLNQVVMAEMELHYDDRGNRIAPPNFVDTYRLAFSTLPNDGVFRATVHTSPGDVAVGVEMDSISRLNSYGNQSYCAQDAMAKKICFCYKPDVLALKHLYSQKTQKVVYEYLQHHEDDFYDAMEENKTVTGHS